MKELEIWKILEKKNATMPEEQDVEACADLIKISVELWLTSMAWLDLVARPWAYTEEEGKFINLKMRTL